jgi:hypothetical protein
MGQNLRVLLKRSFMTSGSVKSQLKTRKRNATLGRTGPQELVLHKKVK